MYIIVAGKVLVHDGDKPLSILGEKEVFGELAALDPEPRSASVTALEDTYLFRMEQELLFELIAQYGDVPRGIGLSLYTAVNSEVVKGNGYRFPVD